MALSVDASFSFSRASLRLSEKTKTFHERLKGVFVEGDEGDSQRGMRNQSKASEGMQSQTKPMEGSSVIPKNIP